MITLGQGSRKTGYKFIIALAGALLINLLLMVLIPWLFRGGGEPRKLVRQRENPVFVAPLKLEKAAAQSRMKPEPPPKIKLPRVLPQSQSPLPLPEINPQIKLSPVKLNPEIENNFTLAPLPESPSAVPAPVVAVERDFYRVGELDHEPVNQVRMQPVYPFRARRRGIEGSVKIRFFVTRVGRVSGLEIVKAEPVGVFENAVRQTVSKWRFQPGVVAGNKVKTLVETTIIFKLGH